MLFSAPVARAVGAFLSTGRFAAPSGSPKGSPSG
jgi:hypothetical protein